MQWLLNRASNLQAVMAWIFSCTLILSKELPGANVATRQSIEKIPTWDNFIAPCSDETCTIPRKGREKRKVTIGSVGFPLWHLKHDLCSPEQTVPPQVSKSPWHLGATMRWLPTCTLEASHFLCHRSFKMFTSAKKVKFHHLQGVLLGKFIFKPTMWNVKITLSSLSIWAIPKGVWCEG